MFSTRKFLSAGLRMTLNLMQENVISMQSLRKSLLTIHQNSFAYSQKASQLSYQPPLQFDDSDEGKKLLAQLSGKLHLAFTCKRCQTRNSKIITKHAYEKGIVIVRCDGCQNNHLIADNLGWFGSADSPRNIEYIMKQKGETVRRVRDNSEGYFEVLAQEEILQIQQRIKAQEKPEMKNDHEETPKLNYQKVGGPEDPK